MISDWQRRGKSIVFSLRSDWLVFFLAVTRFEYSQCCGIWLYDDNNNDDNKEIKRFPRVFIFKLI